jgi:flavin reductase (DIM6/NTAB) family NADH-FMN oxidoreductase RutF
MKVLNEKDLDEMEKRYRGRFINSLTGFKGANLIGTIGEGNSNLAIISSVVHLGADPALVGFVSRPDTVPRHTLENIRKHKYYTINHINESIYQAAHQSSARYEQEVSEFKACQLTEDYTQEFKAPFVKESHLKMGVELVREIPIEENGTHFIIGKIVLVLMDKDYVAEDGYIKIEEAGSLAISGLDGYHQTNLLKRLPYAKP